MYKNQNRNVDCGYHCGLIIDDKESVLGTISKLVNNKCK